MNAVDPALAAKAAATRPQMLPKRRRDDHAFLAADLEILETPASPIRLALILTIAAFALIAMTWAWFGHIEIIAIAQGKIQPTGRVKVIQPVETGKVAALHVENGERVAAGDVLIEMETGDAKAEAAATSAELSAAQAEVLRRTTALSLARRDPIPTSTTIDWPTDIPAPIRAREEHVLAGDLQQLTNSIASFDAQIAQKIVERDRLSDTVAAEEDLLKTLTERVDMRSALASISAGSRSNVLDAIETLQTQRTVLTTQKNQRDTAIANIDVLKRDRAKAISSFIADNEQKLADAARKVDGLQEKRIKDQLRLDHLTLKSPIAGTVTGLTVTTVGQVITTGEEVLRIVPEGAHLEIEAYLANRDIGFIHAGQPVIIKVDSFPFTRYGSLHGEVTRVGRDALPEQDARNAEAIGTQGAKPAMFATAERTQNLVYPVTIALKETTITVDGEAVPLKPGMAVSAEVATGKRRIIDYFLAPLVEVQSQAIRER